MAPDVNLTAASRGIFRRKIPTLGCQALMRAILIRTQFLPAVRHVIGWRGLKQSSAGVEGGGVDRKNQGLRRGVRQGNSRIFRLPHPCCFNTLRGCFELTLFPRFHLRSQIVF